MNRTNHYGQARETRGIDHVIVGTADLDAAAAGFARLGFNVSPKMVHPFGTANRLIMFGDNFIELLGIEDASRLGRLVVLRDFLRATGGGTWGLVFRALDAGAEWRRCADEGLEPGELQRDVERAVDMPDGTRKMARFSSFGLGATATTTYMEGFSQQHVPDAVWIPEWQVHGNGALGMTAVTVATNNLVAFEDRYASLFGSGCVSRADNRLVVETPSGRIDTVQPAILEQRFGGLAGAKAGPWPRIVGATLCVEEFSRLRQLLRDRDVPFELSAGGSVCVAPERACGLALEFTPWDARRAVQ
ncbi:MAG: VOC family protein [Gammaproteobacteria bacterium]|nr:VOC family protein [Gammaproteobacteria bacterium]MDE0366132.1 VOC family protein [Gammaproteobacteria bacterium]